MGAKIYTWRGATVSLGAKITWRGANNYYLTAKIIIGITVQIGQFIFDQLLISYYSVFLQVGHLAD